MLRRRIGIAGAVGAVLLLSVGAVGVRAQTPINVEVDSLPEDSSYLLEFAGHRWLWQLDDFEGTGAGADITEPVQVTLTRTSDCTVVVDFEAAPGSDSVIEYRDGQWIVSHPDGSDSGPGKEEYTGDDPCPEMPETATDPVAPGSTDASQAMLAALALGALAFSAVFRRNWTRRV